MFSSQKTFPGNLSAILTAFPTLHRMAKSFRFIVGGAGGKVLREWGGKMEGLKGEVGKRF